MPFVKMNGLGNDFVVVDAREGAMRFAAPVVRAIADRAHGIGCDQFVVLERSGAGADVFMRLFNADGGEIDACGNASRCVAGLLADELGRDTVTIETAAGLLSARVEGGRASVDMGVPRFEWDRIPLAEPFADTTGIELQVGPIDAPVLHTPSVVSMGNPHAVFWVDADPDTYALDKFGPMLENHPIFPERANISIARVLSDDAIRARVWERGAGLTRACGTGACAIAVSAMRKGLAGAKTRTLTVHLPGGPLEIAWPAETGRVVMSGAWARDGEGIIPEALLGTDAA